MLSELLNTPAGTYLREGKGMRIRYTTIASPIGRVLVATTEKGICAVSIGKSDAVLEASLFNEYRAAEIQRDRTGLDKYATGLLRYLEGKKLICLWI